MAKKVPEALPSWTVMVLMGADNVPGEAPLTKESESDLAEMEAVPFDSTALNIVVQIDHPKGERYGGAGRYPSVQRADGSRKVPRSHRARQARCENPKNFVTWAKEPIRRNTTC